jgi:hypothetical protein
MDVFRVILTSQRALNVVFCSSISQTIDQVSRLDTNNISVILRQITNMVLYWPIRHSICSSSNVKNTTSITETKIIPLYISHEESSNLFEKMGLNKSYN